MADYNLSETTSDLRVNMPVRTVNTLAELTPTSGLFKNKFHRGIIASGTTDETSKMNHKKAGSGFLATSVEKKPIILPGYCPQPGMNSRKIERGQAMFKGAIREIVPPLASNKNSSVKKIKIQSSTYTVYENDCLYSDLFGSVDLQDLLSIFSLCHKSKFTSN